MLASGNRQSGLTGTQVAGLLKSYRETGFGYVDYADQSAYGFSLADPAFVTGHLIRQSAWELISYHESGWDRRQDVIGLRKEIDRVRVPPAEV